MKPLIRKHKYVSSTDYFFKLSFALLLFFASYQVCVVDVRCDIFSSFNTQLRVCL